MHLHCAKAIETLVRERDEARARADSFGLHAEQSVARCQATEAEAARLREALTEVEDRLNCRGNPDVAHYCPNCDNSLHKAREIARAALEGK